MAVTNTGIVLRTITGVNESDLFLDSESTSVATNTGIVERSILGVHDANFVHPIGDEEIIDGGFDDASNWTSSGWVVSNSQASCSGITANLLQSVSGSANKQFRVVFTVSGYVSGSMRPAFVGKYSDSLAYSANGTYTAYISSLSDLRFVLYGNSFNGVVDSVSLKEVLVNRESTTTNTGIVERAITGLNESVAFRQDTRTNLITYSEDFSNAAWLKTGDAVIESGYLAPDGNSTAYKISGTNGATFIPSGLLTTTARSIYARTVSGTGTAQLLSFNSNTNNLFTITEQWQRFGLNTSNTTGEENFYAVDFRGVGTLSEVVLWGAQAEDSLQATSYIYTNGAAVTVDNNSTSSVNNTGIVERPITGVNTSDALFPDNTESTVVNISDTIIPLLTALEARATTFENREGTQNILINLQKC